MTFTAEQKAALSAKLNPDHVKGRQQGGMSVSYIEGWHAIAEANRIFGFDGWTRETVLLEQTNRDLVDTKKGSQQWRIGYIAKVRITVGDTVREGTGYGSGMGRPEAVGDAVEGAIKEAETDAMKRALMTFGNPFGLALYDKTRANVGHDDPARMTPVQRKEAGLWKGPLLVTALKHKLRDLATALDECTSQECVTDLTEEYAEVLLQASEDLPDWYEKAEVKIQEVLTVTKDGEPAEPVSDYLVPVALSNGHADWDTWRQQVENLIDTAGGLETVNEIAEANQPAFANFTKAQKDNAAALKQIIENKRGFFAQAPA